MKFRFIYILLLSFAVQVGAQSGTNQWISYSQKYFKFPVTANGIYKITYNTLLNAGISVGVGGINPKSIQVFGRGEEQYIYVNGEEDDDFFDPSDYVLVYAQKNDGYFDAAMFKDPSNNPNPYYSIAIDTSYYFFTYNSLSSGNKRMNLDTDQGYTGYTASAYFNFETVQSFSDQYGPGKTTAIETYKPSYSAGEGWVGPTLFFDDNKSYSFSTPNYYASGGNGIIETTIVGLTNDGYHDPDHQLTISINDIVKKDTTYEGHEFLKFSFSLPSNEWASTSVIKFKSGGDQSFTSADRSAVGYIKVKYPHTFDFGNATAMEMEVLNGNTDKAFLVISNFNDQGGSTPWLFDLTGHYIRRVNKNANIFN